MTKNEYTTEEKEVIAESMAMRSKLTGVLNIQTGLSVSYAEAVNIYEQHQKYQHQDTTLVPIEENAHMEKAKDSIDNDTWMKEYWEFGIKELNVTPGEWIKNGVNGIHDSNGNCIALTQSLNRTQKENDAYLIAQVKNMYATLKVLADIDITGVTGDIVYQRNESFIKVSDVINARTILNNCKPKQ